MGQQNSQEEHLHRSQQQRGNEYQEAQTPNNTRDSQQIQNNANNLRYSQSHLSQSAALNQQIPPPNNPTSYTHHSTTNYYPNQTNQFRQSQNGAMVQQSSNTNTNTTGMIGPKKQQNSIQNLIEQAKMNHDQQELVEDHPTKNTYIRSSSFSGQQIQALTSVRHPSNSQQSQQVQLQTMQQNKQQPLLNLQIPPSPNPNQQVNDQHNSLYMMQRPQIAEINHHQFSRDASQANICDLSTISEGQSFVINAATASGRNSGGIFLQQGPDHLIQNKNDKGQYQQISNKNDMIVSTKLGMIEAENCSKFQRNSKNALVSNSTTKAKKDSNQHLKSKKAKQASSVLQQSNHTPSSSIHSSSYNQYVHHQNRPSGVPHISNQQSITNNLNSGRSTLTAGIQTRDELVDKQSLNGNGNGVNNNKKRHKADMVRHTGKTLKVQSGQNSKRNNNGNQQDAHQQMNQQSSQQAANFTNSVLHTRKQNLTTNTSKTSKNVNKTTNQTNQDTFSHQQKQQKTTRQGVIGSSSTNEAYEHQIRELKRQVEILQMRQKRVGSDHYHLYEEEENKRESNLKAVDGRRAEPEFQTAPMSCDGKFARLAGGTTKAATHEQNRNLNSQNQSNLAASVSQENLNMLLNEGEVHEQFDKAISQQQHHFGNGSQTMPDFAKSECKPSQNPKLSSRGGLTIPPQIMMMQSSVTPQNMHYSRLAHQSTHLGNQQPSSTLIEVVNKDSSSHLQDHLGGCSRSEHLRSPERASKNAYLSRKMEANFTPLGTKFGISGKSELATSNKRQRNVTQTNMQNSQQMMIRGSVNGGSAMPKVGVTTSLSDLGGNKGVIVSKGGTKTSGVGGPDDLYPDDISVWKKSVHTSMTSRVLHEHDRSQQAMRQSFNSLKHQNLSKFQSRLAGNNQNNHSRGIDNSGFEKNQKRRAINDHSSAANQISSLLEAPQISNFSHRNVAMSPQSSRQQSFTTSENNKQMRLEIPQKSQNTAIYSYRGQKNTTTLFDKESGLELPQQMDRGKNVESVQDDDVVMISSQIENRGDIQAARRSIEMQQQDEDIMFSPDQREILTMSPPRAVNNDTQSNHVPRAVINSEVQSKSETQPQQANEIFSQDDRRRSIEFGGEEEKEQEEGHQDFQNMTNNERQALQAAQNLIRLKEIDRKIHAMQQKKQRQKEVQLGGGRSSHQQPSVYSQRNTQTKKLQTVGQTASSTTKQSLGREKRRKAKEVLAKGLQAEKERQLLRMNQEILDQNNNPSQSQSQSQGGVVGMNYFSGGTRSVQDSTHSEIKPQRGSRQIIQFGGGSDTLLEPIIAMTLVMYDPESFRKLLCLSPNWHYLVLQGMDESFKQLETGFINTYYEHLFFKRSYTNSSVIYTGGRRGIRVDRVIVCEVLKNSKHINKCLAASLAYKMLHYEKNSIVIGPGKAKAKRDLQLERESIEHLATYCMDVKKAGDSRLVWLHRDQQEEQSQLRLYSDSKVAQEILQRPCLQPIVQVCEGDMIEIAVNFFSLAGLLDLSSVEWLEPQLKEPSKETVLTYDKDLHQQNPYRITKIHCDLSRICEVEDSVVEWYDSQYFQKQILSFDHLKDNFKIQNYQCAGVDGLICKLHLVATKAGKVHDPLLGIPILIKDSNSLIQRFQRRLSAISSNYHDDGDQVVVSEIKRMGFLIDRYVDLQLRVGDSLVVYLQRAPC